MQLLKWRSTPPDLGGRTPEQFARHLDTMTYAQYLRSLGYGDEVVKTVEPVIGLISGASPDAVSAHAAQQIGMPGVSRPRGQMTRQFSGAGFDARRDVAGVILKRWGHARLVQPPRWYYGTAEGREGGCRGWIWEDRDRERGAERAPEYDGRHSARQATS